MRNQCRQVRHSSKHDSIIGQSDSQSGHSTHWCLTTWGLLLLAHNYYCKRRATLWSMVSPKTKVHIDISEALNHSLFHSFNRESSNSAAAIVVDLAAEAVAAAAYTYLSSKHRLQPPKRGREKDIINISLYFCLFLLDYSNLCPCSILLWRFVLQCHTASAVWCSVPASVKHMNAHSTVTCCPAFSD